MEVYLANSFAVEIKQMFVNISQDRGVYLELPEFDLEDQNLLSKPIFFFLHQIIFKRKFYNDAFLSIELVRSGINQWTINGDLETLFQFKRRKLLNFFKIPFITFLDNFLEVQPLNLEFQVKRLMVSIQGLNNFEDFQSVESELDKIFAIQSRAFHSFKREKVITILNYFKQKHL